MPAEGAKARGAENLVASVRPRKRTMLFMAHLFGRLSADPEGEPDRLSQADARPANAGSDPGCCDDRPDAE